MPSAASGQAVDSGPPLAFRDIHVHEMRMLPFKYHPSIASYAVTTSSALYSSLVSVGLSPDWLPPDAVVCVPASSCFC